MGGRWRTSLGPIAGREVARLVSVPGSAKGGLGALVWHHVGVVTITFAVRGLGGPVVGWKRAGGEKGRHLNARGGPPKRTALFGPEPKRYQVGEQIIKTFCIGSGAAIVPPDPEADLSQCQAISQGP